MGALGLLILMLFLFIRLSWPHTEALGSPAFGINFSCNHAEYLLLESPAPGASLSDDRPGRVEWCAQTLGTLLSGLNARYLRLSVEWSQVEPNPGAFDWSLIDALLAEADRHGASVMLTVGVKAQRHPEYYIPPWALANINLKPDTDISTDPYLRSRALSVIEAAVRHFAASPAIDAWGADNEPYVPSGRSHGWQLGAAFVRAEVETIRRNDPAARPISINHGQHFVFDHRWRDALADSDILAQSLYPWRNYELLGWRFVVPILEIGPLAPNYRAQARRAAELQRQFWITEMQAEPWFDGDMRTLSPAHPSPNLTSARFRKNIDYARRVGASRVYLWGAEWWLLQRQRHADSTWWDLAREAIAP